MTQNEMTPLRHFWKKTLLLQSFSEIQVFNQIKEK